MLKKIFSDDIGESKAQEKLLPERAALLEKKFNWYGNQIIKIPQEAIKIINSEAWLKFADCKALSLFFQAGLLDYNPEALPEGVNIYTDFSFGGFQTFIVIYQLTESGSLKELGGDEEEFTDPEEFAARIIDLDAQARDRIM